MNRKAIEEKFLDLIEGTLSAQESSELLSIIAADQELSKSFQEYRNIIEEESQIRSEAWTPNHNFLINIMEKIEHEENRSRGSMLIMRLSMLSQLATKRSTIAALSLVLVVGVSTKIYLNAPKDSLYKDAVSTASTFIPPKQNQEVAQDLVAAIKGDSTPTTNTTKTENVELDKEMSEYVAKNAEVFKKLADRIAENEAGLAVAPVPQLEQKGGTQYAPSMANADGGGPAFGATIEYDKSSSVLGGMINSRAEISDGYNQPTVSSESYSNNVENQRIWTAQEATSTFSIDVDTASYSNARRYLQLGQLPPKDAVRVEEFINYFNYNYPTQREQPFAVHYELAPSPLQPDRMFLKLGVKAKDAAQSEAGWNLVFLIDTSGSMSDDNKLPLVKKSLQLLADKMKANDKVAIVTYAGEAGVALEPTSISDRAKILSAIEKLGAGGSTNGSGGINAAYEIAEKMKVAGAVNRVVLATDGDFNVGVTSQDELRKLIEEKRKSGITLTTLGFGTGNIHDDTMEQLADKGNGNYFYIDSFKEARKVLETDLAGNMEVVAKDVKLQIEFNPSKVAAYRLVGYENRKLANEDFKNDKVDAGEIGSGHTVTAIYEVVMKGSDFEKTLKTDSRYQPVKDVAVANDLNEVGFLKVRFKAPEGDVSKEMSFPIDPAQAKKSVSEASADFKFASAVAYFGEVLHESAFADNLSLTEIAKLAESALGEDKFGYRREFVEMVNNARAVKK